MLDSTLLLFLVVDPFGNLPFVLAVLGGLEPRAYRRAIFREAALAWLVLIVFAIAGEELMRLLQIERPALFVAGGVILFLISLRMIFAYSGELFDDRYADDPVLIPIAVPSLAGPSAMTTIVLLHSQREVGLGVLVTALTIVFVVACLVFLCGRWFSAHLGPRGLSALERLTGLLLNVLAVNMMLIGLREFLDSVA